jgi:hypothetical protein
MIFLLADGSPAPAIRTVAGAHTKKLTGLGIENRCADRSAS